MNTRYKSNRNLTITFDEDYKGHPVISHNDGLIENYLSRIDDVINLALDDHARTMAVRLDLRFNDDCVDTSSGTIKKFIASLQSKVESDLKRKKRKGIRVHRCNIRYVWVKEKDTALYPHYHVVLFFNKDTYAYLGSYKGEGNLSNIIKSAWASAVGLDLNGAGSLVYFPKNPIYYIDDNSDRVIDQCGELMFRLSYFAKSKTKQYGSRCKNFGSSRK